MNSVLIAAAFAQPLLIRVVLRSWESWAIHSLDEVHLRKDASNFNELWEQWARCASPSRPRKKIERAISR